MTSAPNPLLRSIPLKTIQKRIRYAKNLNLKFVDQSEIDRAISECLLGFASPSFSLENWGRRSIYRSVKPDGRSIETVDDVKYPPSKFVEKYGRANKPREPIFYGATEVDTTVLELRPNVDDIIFVAEWQLRGESSPIVREVGLIETLNHVRPDLGAKLGDWLTPGKTQGVSGSDIIKQQDIRDFLSDEFTKIVRTGFEHEYRIPASIASALITGKADGLIYGSIASEQSGVNLVLKPSALDKYYKLINCAELRIIEQIDTFKYRAKKVRVSKGVDGQGVISW